MDSEMINTLLQTVLIPVLVAITGFVIKWLNAKAAEIKTQTNNEMLNKYIDLLNNTIIECVTATNQTFVNELKQNNQWTEETAKEAFAKTFNAVTNILTEEARTYLTQAYGDLDTYLTQKIETEVYLLK